MPRVMAWVCFLLAIPFMLVSIAMVYLMLRDRYWPKGSHFRRLLRRGKVRTPKQ